MHKDIYSDPNYRFNSSIEIGVKTLFVSIDGLEEAVFRSHDMDSCLYGNPEASAVLLEFHKNQTWKQPLDRDGMIAKMKSILSLRGYGVLATVIDHHCEDLKSSPTLTSLWKEVIEPAFVQEAIHHAIARDNDFTAAISLCHPSQCDSQTHPRAILFIKEHWPVLVERYNAREERIECRA